MNDWHIKLEGKTLISYIYWLESKRDLHMSDVLPVLPKKKAGFHAIIHLYNLAEKLKNNIPSSASPCEIVKPHTLSKFVVPGSSDTLKEISLACRDTYQRQPYMCTWSFMRALNVYTKRASGLQSIMCATSILVLIHRAWVKTVWILISWLH